MSDTFDYEKAQRWITMWVNTVDHPQMTWAWDIVIGVLDVHAAAGLTPLNSMKEQRSELWTDWFASWEGGDAHFAVHGAMHEFANACPEERISEQILTVNEAYEIGIGKGKGVRARAKEKKAAPTPKAATLRVVVDNTTTAKAPKGGAK